MQLQVLAEEAVFKVNRMVVATPSKLEYGLPMVCLI